MAIAIQQAELYRQLQTELAERRHTEASLRVSEQRYATLTEMSPVGIFQTDAVGNCLYVNERWCQIAGLPPAEATGLGWINSIHPADRDVVSTEWHASAQAGRPLYLEYRCQNAAGQITWVLGQAVVKRGATGEIIGYVGTITDISDRKQAEDSLQQLNQELETRVQERTAKLQASEARLREAQRIAHVGDWEFALASQTITWSEELFHLFECDPAQGEPKYAGHLQSYVLESRLQLEHAVQQAATLGTPYELELQFSRADGSVRWLFARGEAVRNAQGAIAKLLGTALDITDRKQAEVQLRHLSDRLTLAVKSGAIAIWDWNVTENILTWDDRMYELYGITPNQFTNVYDAWANSVHPDDRSFAEAALQQTLAGEKDYDIEFRVIHPDGTIRFLKAYALMERDEQGELKQMVGINYDITEHKQIEQALQQLTLDLQRSNQELEQFAYVASHDLQEPLRAITSYTQLLAKRYQGQLDEKADKYIYYVVDGATRMQQLIQDLLAYSRVGRYELKQQPTDCNAVLQQVQQNLQAAIAESNAVLTIDPLPTIFADTVQVMQLFQNLVGNALKYRGDAPPTIRVSARQQSKAWVFSVQDNGIGIEPQYAERIFEIFQRLHTRREYEGTGLGLAICKKIVERHHGHLWVESQLGQGALFCFALPALLDG
jgi:PAS domain S-box-containing protein